MEDALGNSPRAKAMQERAAMFSSRLDVLAAKLGEVAHRHVAIHKKSTAGDN
jgi:hypothetical protein